MKSKKCKSTRHESRATWLGEVSSRTAKHVCVMTCDPQHHTHQEGRATAHTGHCNPVLVEEVKTKELRTVS